MANIEARLKANRLHHGSIVEWQTRTLVQFISATVPVEKGKKNPLAAEADKVRLRLEDDEGQADNDAPPEVFVEQGSQIAENAPGSFEKLMGGFR